MAGIFISYRRGDTLLEAGLLREALARRFPEPVFRDHDAIPPGFDFASFINRAVADADVVLVLIGPDWLDQLDDRRRRTEPDFVRLEIARALELDRHVVPVLVERPVAFSVSDAERTKTDSDVRATQVPATAERVAETRESRADARSGRSATDATVFTDRVATVDLLPEMPAVDRLPDDIRAVAYRNARTLRRTTFPDDAQQLATDIEPFVRDWRTRLRRRWRRSSPLVVPLAIALMVAAAAAALYAVVQPPDTMDPFGLDVAVAGWQVTSDEAPADDAALGNAVGDAVAVQLRSALDIGPAKPTGNDVWGPDLVGVVSGTTTAARLASARDLGHAVEADVVVYGTATATPSGRYAVDVGFALIGDDERRPTDPVGVERVFYGSRAVDLARLRPEDIAEALPAVGAVSQLALGLRDLDADYLDAAETRFRELVDTAASPQIEAIAHLMLGLTASRRAEIGNREAHLAIAENSYEAALATDPQWRAARLGALGVRYLRAIGDPDAQDGRADQTALRATRDGYQSVVDSWSGPSISAEIAQAIVMIGQINLVLAAIATAPTATADLRDDAEIRFRQVIDYAADDDAEELRIVASGAWAGVALVESEREQMAAAISAYQKARRLVGGYWWAQYGVSIGGLHLVQGDYCQARDELESGLADLRGRPEVSPGSLAEYEKWLAEASRRCVRP
jgi:tetratricopeptide (TPR) repeat protein